MRIMLKKEVAERIGCSMAVLNRLVKSGQFPRPARSGDTPIWIESVVEDAINQWSRKGRKIPRAPIRLRRPKSIVDNAVKICGHVAMTTEQIVASASRPPSECGVYFLVSGGKVVYVGQSRNASIRVGEHSRGGKEFDRWLLLPCDCSDLDLLESFYINRLKPPLNGVNQYGEYSAPMGIADLAKHLNPYKRSDDHNVGRTMGKLSTTE